MNKILQLLLGIIIFSSGQMVSAGTNVNNRSLQSLRNMDGQFATEVGLLENPSVKTQLIKLIGRKEYSIMKRNWNIETPIKVIGPSVIAQGCKRHDCNNTSYIVVINTKSGIVDIGYKPSEGYKRLAVSGKKDVNTIPPAIEEWQRQGK